jgi:RimJ/RimL family protein N-acetyltransferase
MQLLPSAEYSKVYPLVRGSGMKGCCAKWHSVLEGAQPGDVFVDDRANPRTALIRGYRVAHYLFGDAESAAFRQFLPDWIEGRIAPSGGSVFATSESVRAVLNNVLPKEQHRLAYRYAPPSSPWPPPNWREALPSGFTVRWMDKRLTQTVVDAIAPWNWFDARWGGIGGFLDRGFGFCTLSDTGEVGSFCVTSMVGGGEAEIQIVTSPKYQRRGLATLTAFAFLEHCAANDLIPGWTTDPGNEPSQSLAPKLGFELQGPIYYWDLPKVPPIR